MSAEISIKHVHKAMNSARTEHQHPGELHQITVCLCHEGLLDFAKASSNYRKLSSREKEIFYVPRHLTHKYIRPKGK